MQRAQATLEDAEREIDALSIKRREAEAGVEGIISVLHSAVDFIRELAELDLATDEALGRVDPMVEAAR